MDVRYLKTFVALAESGNVTRTAERLDYAPSSVAAHIHALEDELGVPLIERVGRGIALTQAGRAFVAHAKRIIDAERSAIADVRSTAVPSDCVSVGSAASFASVVLPRVLARARAAHRDLSVSTRQGMCSDHLSALRDADLDVVFTIEGRGEFDRLRDATMATEALTTVPIVTVVAPTHRLALAAPIGPSALEGETLIDSEPGCSYREAFAKYLDDAGVRIGARLDFESYEAIRRCAVDGVGVALIPHFVVADELARGTLVELALRPPGEFVVAVTWRPATMTDATREVLAAARAEVATLAHLTAQG